MLREIVGVVAKDDFVLECEMENGEIYEYDMSFVKTEKGEVMEPLKDVKVFKKVWLDKDFGALEWPSGLGIHGNTVARDGVLVKKPS